jgi:putative restriction endonuclease
MQRKNWSRAELILAFNLYCKTPFGRIHTHNPQIIALAKILGRSPSSVSWKLANFARLDPSLRRRNIVGATHGGKGEIEVWREFNGDWEGLSFESERLLAEITGKKVEEISKIDKTYLPKEGKEREAMVRVRVNQNFFRTTVLAAYDFKCCITGLGVTELLNASHIVPWAVDRVNRVNPRNGLCLNALHDRAFDRGLLTITSDYKVKLSPSLKISAGDEAAREFLQKYDDATITLPSRFMPDQTFLKYHNQKVFKR